MMFLAEFADHSVAVAGHGVELGSVIAVVCSWQRNRSIFWAVVAGLFTWFYVLHFALTRQPDERRK